MPETHATGSIVAQTFNPIYDTFDVTTQDRTDQPFIIYFNQVQTTTTLAVAAVIDDTSITVVNATGIVVGRYIIIYSIITNRVYMGNVISVVGNVIGLDTPIDSNLPIGSYVDNAIKNMNVNGSVTRQIFGIRGLGVTPGIALNVYITRILFQILTSGPIDLGSFGDLPALAKGVVLRKRDDTTYNIFNIKKNGDIANLTFDTYTYAATNPAQGVDGLTARLTFAGHEKMGTAIEIPAGDDLEIIIQDNLTGIVEFRIIAEGRYSNRILE